MTMATLCPTCCGSGDVCIQYHKLRPSLKPCPMCDGLGWRGVTSVKVRGISHIVHWRKNWKLMTACSSWQSDPGEEALSTERPKRRCRRCVATVRAEGRRLTDAELSRRKRSK